MTKYKINEETTMTDFHERAIVADELQTIYQPPETTSMFSDLLDRIEAGKTVPEKTEPRGLRTMFMRMVRS